MELIKLTVLVLFVALMSHAHVTESRKENNKNHPNGHKPWKSTNCNKPSKSSPKDIKSSKEWKSKGSKKSSKPVCGELPSVDDGHFYLDVYGDSASLTCSSEFEIDGNDVVTCQSDGTWSEPGQCIQACEALPVVTGGEYSTTSFLTGSTAELTCETNFKLVNGPSTITCQEDQTWTSTTSCCFGLVDLVFVLDGSASIGKDNFKLLKTFLQDLVTLVKTPNTQFGLLLFSTDAVVQFHLNEYNNMPDEVNADIADTTYPAMLEKHTVKALDLVRTSMLTPMNGRRDNATQVVLVIVDGWSADPSETIYAAVALRELGVKIMALGVSLDYRDEIDEMSSKPQFGLEASFTTESLAAVQTQVQAVLCNIIQPGG